MAYKEKINYYKVRNFSQKFNVTIEFIRQNAMPLGKSILYILGPLAVLNGLLFSQYINYSFSQMSGQEQVDMQNPFAMMLTPSYIGFMLLSSFGVMLNVSVILNYMKLYRKKFPEEITVVEVVNAAIKSLLPIIVLGVLVWIIVVLGTLALIIPGMYLMIALSFSIHALLFEGKGITESIGRSLKLINDKWWSTFGLLLVSSIIMYAVSLIFSIPLYTLSFIGGLTNLELYSSSTWFQVGNIIAVMLSLAGSYLTYSIPVVALSFQYFNLVERRESKGLMGEIDRLE